MQIIFPQARQLGAAIRTSWMRPMHAHLRRTAWRVGLVEISSVRRADSRSSRSFETPRMEVPPVT